MRSPHFVLPLVLAIGFGMASCGDDDAAPAAATTPAAAAAPAPFTVLTPAQGAALIAERPDVVVIDVRRPDEYAAGHLASAALVDVSAPTFDAKIAELPADGAYVVYCRSGNRSAQAVTRMREAGFTEVYDLGGIVAWQAAGYPVVTG